MTDQQTDQQEAHLDSQCSGEPQATAGENHAFGLGTKQRKSDGYCLECGRRLTRCGVAFSGEFSCPGCGAVNVYENSQQPVRRA